MEKKNNYMDTLRDKLERDSLGMTKNKKPQRCTESLLIAAPNNVI